MRRRATYISLALILTACAHVPTKEQQIGAFREAFFAYDNAFKRWFVDNMAKAEDIDRWKYLMQADREWEGFAKAIELALQKNTPELVQSLMEEAKYWLAKTGIIIGGKL